MERLGPEDKLLIGVQRRIFQAASYQNSEFNQIYYVATIYAYVAEKGSERPTIVHFSAKFSAMTEIDKFKALKDTCKYLCMLPQFNIRQNQLHYPSSVYRML